jgi:hypothetical protein
MSWFYRFFTKSDNEQVVTLNSPYIQLTGSATLTGALAQTGAQTVTGNLTVTGDVGVTGAHDVTGDQTVSGTIKAGTSPLYLGSGTLGIFFGTATPWDTGVTGADKGSIYLQTVGGTIYYKTDYGSKSWSTVTGTTS